MSDLTQTNIIPESPEKRKNANLKERLNLHVKRRLQEDVAVSSMVDQYHKCAAHKESVKARRPYQKRTEKVKSETTVKISRPPSGANGNNDTSAALDGVDDQEGTQEIDGKQCSNKDKYPDLLNMILNVKKRALIQDPNVQKFLNKILNAMNGGASERPFKTLHLSSFNDNL